MAAFNLSEIPAMMPPPGQTSNFNNPSETMHPVVVGVGIATIALMTTALAIRIFTKAFILKEMRAEEYFAVVGTIGIIAWDSIFIHVSMDGFSRHLWDVRIIEVSNLSYMSYLAEITNAPTMFAAKCSILLQFRRIFCTGQTRDSTFWMIHLLLFLNAAYYISAIFTFTFQCTPREKPWKPWLEGHCIDVAAAMVVQGVINLLLDIGILIAPLWAIWRLQLPMKRKVGISAVFGVGFLTCAIAAVGVVVRVPLLWDPDLTWLITRVGVWTMVEYCGTIVVGCMPSFPRFFLYLRGKDPSNTTVSGGSNPNYSNRSNLTRPTTAGRPNTSGGKQQQQQGGSDEEEDLDYHSVIMHSRGKSGGSIGMAVSTSQVSFEDHEYIEMEGGTLRGSTREERCSSSKGRPSGVTETTDREGCNERDWSPLSSPVR